MVEGHVPIDQPFYYTPSTTLVKEANIKQVIQYKNPVKA